MSTNKHTPLAFGAALTATNMNAPLGELDAAIVATDNALAQTALPITTTDASAASGQAVVPVASTDGFVVGQSVWIGDIDGIFEVRTIASIQAGVSLTMTANLTNTYAAGKVVSGSPQELVQARGASATLDARLDAMQAEIDAAEADSAAGPQGIVGYAQVTASQTGITTEVDLTGLTTTATVGANRRVRISAQVLFNSSVAADRIGLEIKDGAGSYLMQGRVIVAAASLNFTFATSVVIVPASGTHIFKLAAVRTNGTGTVQMVASASFPAFILVEDLGAA